MGTSAVLEYFWCKVLEDKKTIIPQFDFETGKENFWKTDDVPLSKVILMPFSCDLAEKVMKNGVAAVSTLNPTVEFIVYPDEKVEAGRVNELTYFDYFKCDICGWEFRHTNGSKFAECPQCHSTDDWFCSRCHEYKYDFRITDKGQVQCNDCDIPVGLDRTRKMIRKSGCTHTCDYFVRSDSGRKITVKNDGSIISE